jgi:hypothetical protein
LSNRRQDKTTKKQIVEWAIRNLDECGMGCDADEYHCRCWRCGYVRNTEMMNLITTDCYAPNVIKKHLMLLIRVQWINGLETRVFQLMIPFGK